MNKPSIFAGLAGLSGMFEFKIPRGFGGHEGFPYPHVKEGQTMLWPSELGTYRRMSHGDLKDESGRPRYA